MHNMCGTNILTNQKQDNFLSVLKWNVNSNTSTMTNVYIFKIIVYFAIK